MASLGSAASAGSSSNTSWSSSAAAGAHVSPSRPPLTPPSLPGPFLSMPMPLPLPLLMAPPFNEAPPAVSVLECVLCPLAVVLLLCWLLSSSAMLLALGWGASRWDSETWRVLSSSRAWCSRRRRLITADDGAPGAVGVAMMCSSAASPLAAPSPVASPSPFTPNRSARAQLSARSSGAAAIADVSSGPSHSSQGAASPRKGTPEASSPARASEAELVAGRSSSWLPDRAACRGALMAASTCPGAANASPRQSLAWLTMK
mmetsp:Transcript_10285/g.30954  ORF Transcript_10285/g.30954 Transcript_10285/m.30954 type:complete len:260 (+) Transcript_10285:1284-2063(+)